MKKILRFEAALVALCFGLMCFVACQDSTKGGTPSGGNPSGDGGSSSQDKKPVEVPANVGDNPFASDSNATGVVLTMYDSEDKDDVHGKVEFNADGTATNFQGRDYNGEDWYETVGFKYSWDTEKKNIYIALAGYYFDFGDGNGCKLFTVATAYADAIIKSEQRYYEKEYEIYKKDEEEADREPLSFDDYMKEMSGMTFDEYRAEMRDVCIEEFNSQMPEEYFTYSYEKKDGKLVFTGVYTGFAPLYLNGYLTSEDQQENWKVNSNYIHYSNREVYTYVDYHVDSYDKTTITYKVDKWDKEDADKLGLPETIVANYTDDVANGKCTITFKDPLTEEEISSNFTFEPGHYYEL